MRTTCTRAAFAVLLAVVPLLVILASLSPVRAQDNGTATSGLSLPVFGPIEGDDGDEGSFQGSVSNLEFINDDGLILTGVVNGIASIGDDTVRITDQEFETPVVPSVAGAVLAEEDGENGSEDGEQAAAGSTLLVRYQDDATQPEPDPDKCDVLFLDIQPIELNLLGLEVLTSRITLDVNAIPGEGNLLGNLLCSLAGLLDDLPSTLDEVTDQLNQIISEAGSALEQAQQSTQGLGSLPLFGTIEGENGETGTFQGTVSDLVFSNDGGTVVDGVLDGITNVDGETRRVVDQPVSSPVQPGVGRSVPQDQFADNPTQPEPDPDKCDVLYLDIQPITLNLLGLEVLTSRITVDVNAIPGEGNLAGNLVCALAGLLDGAPDAVDQITDQLNQIADEIGVSGADAEAQPTADATATEETTGTDDTGTDTAEPTATSDETTADPTDTPEPTSTTEPTMAPEPTTAPAPTNTPESEPTTA